MRRISLITTLALLLCGCTESGEMDNFSGDATASTPIVISIDSETLTRGTPVDTESAMGSVGIYCAHTGQDSWSTSTTFNKMDNSEFGYNSTTLSWDYISVLSEAAPTWGYSSLSDKYTFFAYSPHSSESSGIVPTVVNGALEIAYTVSSDYNKQIDLMVATPRKDIFPQVGGSVTLEFDHTLAKVSFSVKGDSTREVTSINLQDFQNEGNLTFDASGSFSWSNGASTDSFEVSQSNTALDDVTANNTAQNITASDGYLFMLPQDVSGKTVVVSVADADGSNSEDVSFTIPDNQEWVAGGSYNYEITVSKRLVSFHDFYPDVANCYIIDPDTTDEIIIPINEYISYFWTNYGVDDENKTETAYAQLTAAELVAEVIWSDSDSCPVTTSISIDGNISGGTANKDNISTTYPNFAASTSTMAMKFKLDATNSIEGNAVIGVRKSDSSDYLWSWHIWITDYDPYGNGTTYDIDGFTWMDRNLGALSDNYSASATKGNLYYQWGRKDPIGSSPTLSSSASYIADAVKSPDQFYIHNASYTSYDWCGGNTEDTYQDRNYHWRDNQLPSPSATSGDTYGSSKSIFDPSPLGYMVPISTSKSSFVSPFAFLSNSYSREGYNIKGDSGIILLALGLRKGSYGGLEDTTSGYYWSASPCLDEYSTCLIFDSSSKVDLTSGNYRANGLSVRSIKE